jgi:DNA-binding NarL/FixJ family response regulator
LRAGAAGYLLKDAAAAELEQAVKTVAQGDTYLAREVSQHVVSAYRRRLSRDGDNEQPALQSTEVLTSRQREILQLIAEGRTTKEIASLLHRSEKTIEAHRSRLMNQLDIHDVAGLVRYAIRVGIISSEK